MEPHEESAEAGLRWGQWRRGPRTQDDVDEVLRGPLEASGSAVAPLEYVGEVCHRHAPACAALPQRSRVGRMPAESVLAVGEVLTYDGSAPDLDSGRWLGRVVRAGSEQQACRGLKEFPQGVDRTKRV